MNTPFRAARLAAPPLVLGVLSSALALAAHAQATDEIVVTGVLRDRAPGEIAQSVTVVTGETLDRVRAANLGETLSNQLGVSSSYFGAGASRPDHPRPRGGARADARGRHRLDGCGDGQRRSRRHRRAAGCGPDRDLPRPDHVAVRQRRRRRRRQYRHNACSHQAPARRIRGRIRAARRQVADGAQRGRTPRRRRVDASRGISMRPTRQRRLRDSWLRTRRRRRANADPRTHSASSRTVRRERSRCPRRVVDRRRRLSRSSDSTPSTRFTAYRATSMRT